MIFLLILDFFFLDLLVVCDYTVVKHDSVMVQHFPGMAHH